MQGKTEQNGKSVRKVSLNQRNHRIGPETLIVAVFPEHLQLNRTRVGYPLR